MIYEDSQDYPIENAYKIPTTDREIERDLISFNSVSLELSCLNGVDLHELVKDDREKLVYLMQIYVGRKPGRIRDIGEYELPQLQRMTRFLLRRGLPSEVYDRYNMRELEEINPEESTFYSLDF